MQALLARAQRVTFGSRRRLILPSQGQDHMREESTAKQFGSEEDFWSTTNDNDTLIAAEYRDQQRRSQLDPEKRLMLAILQDAVACYMRNSGVRSGKGRRLFLEVETWIKDQANEGLFSFHNICDTLGIDPDYLTRGLFREWNPGLELPEIGHLRLESSSRRRPRRR